MLNTLPHTSPSSILELRSTLCRCYIRALSLLRCGAFSDSILMGGPSNYYQVNDGGAWFVLTLFLLQTCQGHFLALLQLCSSKTSSGIYIDLLREIHYLVVKRLLICPIHHVSLKTLYRCFKGERMDLKGKKVSISK